LVIISHSRKKAPIIIVIILSLMEPVKSLAYFFLAGAVSGLVPATSVPSNFL
jgi:hypothetical protein